MMTAPQRRRLPNRQPAETYDFEVGGIRLAATVGFFAEGVPNERFLSGAKDGSALAAILEDASVTISVALQCGIRARSLAKSISPHPGKPRRPAN